MNVYYVLQLLFVTRLLNHSSLTCNNCCVIIMQTVSECSVPNIWKTTVCEIYQRSICYFSSRQKCIEAPVN